MLSVAAGCGGSDGNERAQPLEVAVQGDGVLVYEDGYNRERALEQARRLGASWIRANVLWARIPGYEPDARRVPAAPRYDFSRFDSLVDAAARHGMRVELTITGPVPAWASGNGRPGAYRPDPELFGRFAAAVAEHFRGRVPRYSVWNEPNYVSWLEPLDEAPALYRALWSAAGPAIKRADPQAQVLIGETSAYELPGKSIAPLAFLDTVACRGCPKLEADGYAHHPYPLPTYPEREHPGPGSVTLASIGRLESELDSLAREGRLSTASGGALPLYLTEFGWFRESVGGPPEPQRATLIVDAFERAAADPRVRQLLQYLLVAPPPGDRFDTSVVDRDGAPTASFRALAGWVGKARGEGLIAAPRSPR